MFFKDVIGQEGVKQKLIKSAREGRISHAQLFLGKTGWGTLPLALAFAQYVNCHNPTNFDSCGVCDSCKRTLALEHPDLHFSFPVIVKKSGNVPVSLDWWDNWKKALKANPYISYIEWMQDIGAENKQGNITALECREIIKKLSLKPLFDGYKIMIIWLPEYLGKEGNVLLKAPLAGQLDVVWLKSFTLETGAAYAHGAAMEVFNSDVHNYAELELHAPLVELAPGACCRFQQQWKFKKV